MGARDTPGGHDSLGASHHVVSSPRYPEPAAEALHCFQVGEAIPPHSLRDVMNAYARDAKICMWCGRVANLIVRLQVWRCRRLSCWCAGIYAIDALNG